MGITPAREAVTQLATEGLTALTQASGADVSAIVILAGGNVELQALVDQVVLRSMRMLRLSPDSDLWTPWVKGYRDGHDVGDLRGGAAFCGHGGRF